jgi:hypothetical protein
MFSPIRVLTRGAAGAALASSAVFARAAGTFPVTTTADLGTGSLRQVTRCASTASASP